MKLDPRINALSDILTVFDIDRAKQFIGQNGYFANALYCYYDLPHCCYGTLECVFNRGGDTFRMEGGNTGLAYFIPESSLKSVEDKPLTLDGIYEKCMNEIKDLRTELNSIKSQLNKATENKSTNSCASIRYPEDWFSAQSNRCASIIYPNGFNPQGNWLEKVHFI